MSERKEEIRAEDKKWSWKFAGMIFGAGILGAGIGVLLIHMQRWAAEGEETLRWLSLVAVPGLALALMWIVLIGELIALPILRRDAVVIAKTDNGEDDTIDGRLNKRLRAVLTITSLATVSVYTCFGITASGLNGVVEDLIDWRWFAVCFPLALAGITLQMVLTMVFQRWSVNFYKERNPEKRGSVYQMNFNKVWLQSCDEAEKLQIFRAGYMGYRVGIYTCLTLFLLSTFSAMMGWISWVTILFVGVIWMAMQVGYLIAARGGATGHSTFIGL